MSYNGRRQDFYDICRFTWEVLEMKIQLQATFAIDSIEILILIISDWILYPYSHEIKKKLGTEYNVKK